jgi:hypothetical protein
VLNILESIEPKSDHVLLVIWSLKWPLNPNKCFVSPVP